MKTAPTLMKKTVLTLLFGIVLGLSRIDAVMSRDTDIYFSNPNAQQQAIKPNILLVLDTSGSMVTNTLPDGRTRLAHMKDALNTILDNVQNAKVGLMRFSSSPGGPVLFPVRDIDSTTAGMKGEGIISVTTAVSASEDDAEQIMSGGSAGSINLTSPDLDMVTQSDPQMIGLRFQNVQVPRGATITSAYIRFQVDETDSGATSLTIKGQNIGNAPAFGTATNAISNRTSAGNATSTPVSWNSIPAWTVGTATDPNYQLSPDIKDIVKDIVGRTDWCSGNSLVLTLEGSGRRVATSYDGDPAGAPVLVVNYDATNVPAANCVVRTLDVRINADNDDVEETVSSGSSNGTMDRDDNTLDLARESGTTQMIGLRFRNIAVPVNSNILSSQIILTSAGTDSTNPSSPVYILQGQKTSNPGGFTTSRFNVSSRISGGNGTTATVNWSGAANLAVNNTLSTPDITSIVSELTGSGNSWSSGNSMVFVFRNNGGSGTRLIRSHDGSTTRAPLLRIRYQENVTLSSTTTMTVRNRLKQIVNGLEASGSTPIVDALWEAGLYYRGQPVLYGLQRGPQWGTSARVTRVSHPASYDFETGVYRATGCTDADLSNVACVTEEILGPAQYVSPFEDGCQNSYIVLLTDGDPTVNNSVSLIESLIGSTCAGTGDGKCANEVTKYYFDNNLSTYSDKHNVVTHAIGFGSDVTSAGSVTFLQGIADSGEGSFFAAADADQLVTAFQQILSEVNSAPTSFVSPSLSVNAFNKLFNRDEVYFSLFSPQKQVRWPGNIKKYKLCNDAKNLTCTFGEVLDDNDNSAIGDDAKIKSDPNAATSIWTTGADRPDGPTVQKGGTGQQIPDHTYGTRNVYTYTGTASATDNDDVPASAENLTLARHVVRQDTVSATLDNPALTKVLLGDSAMSDQRYFDIVNWMRGRDIKDDYPENADGTKGNGNTTENRWRFADALHSRPLTVSYGGTDANPVIKIFVGTNDGGLRMINAETGVEEWIVYIPEMLNDQGVLMDNATGTHFDGLDGTPTAYVIDNDGDGIIEPGSPQNDKVYLYVGMRRGGRDIYAFDVTPTSVITSPTATGGINPKFLWRIRGGSSTGFGTLGQTWSRPLLAKIRVKGASAGKSVLKNVLLFAGGYDPRLDTPGANNVFPTGADTMGNGIYIVDPLTGSLIWRAGGASSGANLQISGMDYAIPSDLALLDIDSDSAVDRIYVGDTRGKVWRVDLGNQIDPSQADVDNATGGSAGHLFANISGTSRQDSRKFFYPPEIAQVTDTVYSDPTTPDYDIVVIASGDREDPLDKLTASISTTEVPVNNRLYAFRDYNYQPGVPTTAPTVITESLLYDATANNLGTFTGSALQNEIDNEVKTKKGWYIRLKETTSPNWIGEKGLAKATIFEGKILFTTFTPTSTSSTASAGTCAPLSEGVGKLYALDYLNATAAFDLDGDGTPDRSTEVGKGIPSETVVVIREDGASTLVGTSGGAARPDIELDMPRYNTFWYQR